MEKLNYSPEVYGDHYGKIYYQIQKWTIWALILLGFEVAALGFINFEKMPHWFFYVFMVVSLVYGVGGTFVFTTCWFLNSGKSRLLKDSSLEVTKKQLVYNKVVSKTGQKAKMNRIVATQIKRVEDTGRMLKVSGNIVNESTHENFTELEIPYCFEGVERVMRLARYH